MTDLSIYYISTAVGTVGVVWAIAWCLVRLGTD